MAVTVNLPANLGDPTPINRDATKGAALNPYVGLVNAPVTRSANEKVITTTRIVLPHQPAQWKVN